MLAILTIPNVGNYLSPSMVFLTRVSNMTYLVVLCLPQPVLQRHK